MSNNENEYKEVGIDTPRIMNQERIDLLLNCNNNTSDKTQETDIINTEYNIIEGLTWLRGRNIVNKDVVSMLFRNINLKSLNMEGIIIKENVLKATFKDSYITEVAIQENNRFNTLIIKNCTIDVLRVDWSRVNRIILYNSKILNFTLEGSIIPFGVLMNYNSSINRLCINESIIKSGILISYGTVINEISITRSIVVNNFKNKINELEELKINDITDIFIEDDLETIARDNFSLKDSLIINNNYSNVEELPDREKIIMSGDGTENNPYATRYYPNYYEQNEFLNGKYKEWNFKKYHRERNCMMCGTYCSADYNNDSEINNLREDI